jgi:hypothetical protein
MLNPKKSQNSITKLQTSDHKPTSIQNNAMTPNPLTTLMSQQQTPAADKHQQPFHLTQPLAAEQSVYSSAHQYNQPALTTTNAYKQMFSSQQNYHPNSLNTSKHTVNKLSFSTKLSPGRSNREANSARHDIANQRSMIAASIA